MRLLAPFLWIFPKLLTVLHRDLLLAKLEADGLDDNALKLILSILAGPISHTSTRCMDLVEIFNIILDLSITCFSHFSGC